MEMYLGDKEQILFVYCEGYLSWLVLQLGSDVGMKFLNPLEKSGFWTPFTEATIENSEFPRKTSGLIFKIGAFLGKWFQQQCSQRSSN